MLKKSWKWHRSIDRGSRRLYEENIELIDEVCQSVCHRFAVGEMDAEDFRSSVHIRLLEHDCGRLRQFDGRCSLRTFLTMVVVNLLKDQRDRDWGRFRPSAAARRKGTVALQLERLRWRDGLDLETAIQMLRINLQVETSEEELRELAGQLPEKPKRILEALAEPEKLPTAATAEDHLAFSEQELAGRRVRIALQAALRTLSSEEQWILKMTFQDGFSVAALARSRARNQRRLYTRIEAAKRKLRRILEGNGVSRASAQECIGWEGWGAIFVDPEA